MNLAFSIWFLPFPFAFLRSDTQFNLRLHKAFLSCPIWLDLCCHRLIGLVPVPFLVTVFIILLLLKLFFVSVEAEDAMSV